MVLKLALPSIPMFKLPVDVPKVVELVFVFMRLLLAYILTVDPDLVTTTFIQVPFENPEAVLGITYPVPTL